MPLQARHRAHCARTVNANTPRANTKAASQTNTTFNTSRAQPYSARQMCPAHAAQHSATPCHCSEPQSSGGTGGLSSRQVCGSWIQTIRAAYSSKFMAESPRLPSARPTSRRASLITTTTTYIQTGMEHPKTQTWANRTQPHETLLSRLLPTLRSARNQ